MSHPSYKYFFWQHRMPYVVDCRISILIWYACFRLYIAFTYFQSRETEHDAKMKDECCHLCSLFHLLKAVSGLLLCMFLRLSSIYTTLGVGEYRTSARNHSFICNDISKFIFVGGMFTTAAVQQLHSILHYIHACTRHNRFDLFLPTYDDYEYQRYEQVSTWSWRRGTQNLRTLLRYLYSKRSPH